MLTSPFTIHYVRVPQVSLNFAFQNAMSFVSYIDTRREDCIFYGVWQKTETFELFSPLTKGILPTQYRKYPNMRYWVWLQTKSWKIIWKSWWSDMFFSHIAVLFCFVCKVWEVLRHFSCTTYIFVPDTDIIVSTAAWRMHDSPHATEMTSTSNVDHRNSLEL